CTAPVSGLPTSFASYGSSKTASLFATSTIRMPSASLWGTWREARTAMFRFCASFSDITVDTTRKRCRDVARCVREAAMVSVRDGQRSNAGGTRSVDARSDPDLVLRARRGAPRPSLPADPGAQVRRHLVDPGGPRRAGRDPHSRRHPRGARGDRRPGQARGRAARRAFAGRGQRADPRDLRRLAPRRHGAQDRARRRVAVRGLPDSRRDPRSSAARRRAARAPRDRRRRLSGISARPARDRDVGVTPQPGDRDAPGALHHLGWDAGWELARAAADPDGGWLPVRIAASHRGAYHALGPGGLAWVELTGRAFHDADDKRALPAVGDWVLVERWAQAL